MGHELMVRGVSASTSRLAVSRFNSLPPFLSPDIKDHAIPTRICSLSHFNSSPSSSSPPSFFPSFGCRNCAGLFGFPVTRAVYTDLHYCLSMSDVVTEQHSKVMLCCKMSFFKEPLASTETTSTKQESCGKEETRSPAREVVVYVRIASIAISVLDWIISISNIAQHNHLLPLNISPFAPFPSTTKIVRLYNQKTTSDCFHGPSLPHNPSTTQSQTIRVD